MTKTFTYYVVEKDGKYLGPDAEYDYWFKEPGNAKMFFNPELAGAFSDVRQAQVRTVTLEVK